MQKVLDKQGRWRNKVIAFRMSPQEDEFLNKKVALSGYTKQDYIINRLMEKEIIVQGNPRVYKALRDQMQEILQELQRIQTHEEMSDDLKEWIALVVTTLEGLKDGEK